MSESISELTNAERLAALDQINRGCQHLFSKGKLQKDKLAAMLPVFMKLADEDPYFLAHYTSYVLKESDNRDIQLLAVFANSLSDADGTPFEAGSEFVKPNLRTVSQAAVQEDVFDAKLLSRLIQIAKMKQPLGKRHGHGSHFSRPLRNALIKYLLFREKNLQILRGVRKVGLRLRYQKLYRYAQVKPSQEAIEILKWQQGSLAKGTRQEKIRDKLFDFSNMTDLEIAKKIRKERLPVTGVLGALEKISPVIAVALLEQATGKQALILRRTFDAQGLMKDREVAALFMEKIKDAGTALDRVDRINTEVDEKLRKVMESTRAEVRKKQIGTLGRVFLHIDISSSMTQALEIAKEYGSIIAECVPQPEKNFFWGTFSTTGVVLPRPRKFEKAAFKSALYGIRAGGNTDLLALYDRSRREECDIDVFITDCEHTAGWENIGRRIDQATSKPKVVGVVNVGNQANFNMFKSFFNEREIPVATIEKEALTQSALVVESLKAALVGSHPLIEKIMGTPLLKIPEWWEAV